MGNDLVNTTFKFSLVPKLQLGNAVLEALLRRPASTPSPSRPSVYSGPAYGGFSTAKRAEVRG